MNEAETGTLAAALVAGAVAVLSAVIAMRGKRDLQHESIAANREDKTLEIAAENLRAQLEGWESYAETLRAEIARLREDAERHRDRIRILEAEKQEWQRERAQITRKISQLERRLGQILGPDMNGNGSDEDGGRGPDRRR